MSSGGQDVWLADDGLVDAFEKALTEHGEERYKAGGKDMREKCAAMILGKAIQLYGAKLGDRMPSKEIVWQIQEQLSNKIREVSDET